MLARKPTFHLSTVLFLATLFTMVNASHAQAQGFISPSFGYNFGGDSGCLEAFDCEDKTNFLSAGALGSVNGLMSSGFGEQAFGEIADQPTIDDHGQLHAGTEDFLALYGPPASD
jgi:hypothetical protein